jgi:tRNA threonylcarbamoyladenosine biosynthesis protein TsaB
MNLLAIDTSTERASLALLANARVHTKEHTNIRQHAAHILPMIDDLINTAGISISDLDGVVFGCGPGSFTGLRVSCSVAKAIAYAHDLPLYPVSSLSAIAYAASSGKITVDTPVLALLDARMNEVYWEYFTDFASDAPIVSKAQDIILQVGKPVILAGVGLDTYACHLPCEIKDLVTAQKVIYPLAEVMIRLVQKNYIKPVSATLAEPKYVRNQVVG